MLQVFKALTSRFLHPGIKPASEVATPVDFDIQESNLPGRKSPQAQAVSTPGCQKPACQCLHLMYSLKQSIYGQFCVKIQWFSVAET